MASSLDSDQARHIFCNSLNLDLSNERPQPLSMSVRNMRVYGIIINDFCK